MNQEVKKKWVEALRSGNYKQNTGSLKNGDKFCCLGVLCDISKLSKWDNISGEICYDDSSTFLPKMVIDWAGLDDDDPCLAEGTCTDYNDSELKTFNEIADLIEKYL